MSKKRAFTMVELIFVIVILGILAAVAVPKLNASRQDAQIAAFEANLNTVLKDIQSYYAANGELYNDDIAINKPNKYTDLTKLTNVSLIQGGSYDYNYRLLLDGKNCIELFVTLYDEVDNYCLKIVNSDYKANETCKSALDKERIKRLFTGYSALYSNTVKNAVEAAKDGTVDTYACYRPGENGVEW